MLVVALASGCIAAPAWARTRPPCAPSPTGDQAWPAPLARRVTFHAPEISLREALDGLAAAARVRLTYSSESLPFDRSVCVSVDSVPLGDALADLLRGAPVELLVVAADHVVLAPTPGAAPGVAGGPPVVLERIVVTGSATGAARLALPVALDVLDGRELTARSAGTLAEALNAAVPGLWMWDQPPLSVRADYGSIRGASSFGLSYPKVYIDGIQVANPLVISAITPEAVDRIEVIRGPQGAALYGADAISGVTNIVTRHETPDAGAPRARLHGRFGLSNSAYASDPTVGQSYLFAPRLGSNTSSLGVTADVGTVGPYVPGASARHVAATANARRVGATSILTATARFAGQWVRSGANPLLPATVPDSGAGAGQAARADSSESLVAYTVGLSARFMPGDRWRHSVVAGVDGYALDGVADRATPIPTLDVSTLRDGTAIRATLRAGTEAHVALGRAAAAVATLAIEQSALHQHVTDDPAGGTSGRGNQLQQIGASAYDWRASTGLVAQVTTALRDRLFLSAGGRLERDAGTDGGARVATLPSAGGAWVLGGDPVTLKLRGAYGKGIRWPETLARQTLAHRGAAATSANALDPEEQAGVEAGLDLLVGGALVLQLTRFDQTASGLIQRVSLAADSAAAPPPGARRVVYAWQNVGEIDNQGWELQGTVRHGALSVAGTFTQVDSRVRAVAGGYQGDLRSGDRTLGVPARTMGVTAVWSAARWSASCTVYRAEDWINYDRLALAQAYAASARPTRDLVGAGLRAFWIEYPGVTRLKVTATLALSYGLSLGVIGDNLLDRQTGAPDNVTVVPGRTLSVSLRAKL